MCPNISTIKPHRAIVNETRHSITFPQHFQSNKMPNETVGSIVTFVCEIDYDFSDNSENKSFECIQNASDAIWVTLHDNENLTACIGMWFAGFWEYIFVHMWTHVLALAHSSSHWFAFVRLVKSIYLVAW